MLSEKLDGLTADGDFSAEDARALFYEAMRLRLNEKAIEGVRRQAIENAIASVRKRAEETCHLTDEDQARINEVATAFDVRITLDDTMKAFREIYRVEVKGELPATLLNAPFLTEPGESVYFQMPTTWAQLRVQRKGYAGTSVSIPTGIRGIRFRFGDVRPITTEKLTPLATGTLFVTNRRLFFDGDKRNTSTKLGRITDLELFRDALEVDKSTGRSDVYLMDALRARFISGIVRGLRRE